MVQHHACRRGRHKVVARIYLLARDGRYQRMERHRSGCVDNEYRRLALRGSHRQHTPVVDHRAQQATHPRGGNLSHHQWHGGAARGASRPGRKHLFHRRRDCRRRRLGAHHHRRLHRDLPHAPQRRHRQCQHRIWRRHRGTCLLRQSHVRDGIQRRDGVKRAHIGAPRRV